MIDELALQKCDRDNTLYHMQLILDTGPSIGPAIIAKLNVMNRRPDIYTVKIHGHWLWPSFGNLYRVLETTGDKRQAPLLARYSHDKRRYDSAFARQAYPAVRTGLRDQLVIGY